MAVITIKLKVDIAKIIKAATSLPRRRRVVAACEISDDLNSASMIGKGCLLGWIPFISSILTSPVRKFTTYVSPNDDVTWIGISTDSNYIVDIHSIVYLYSTSSVNYFDQIVLAGGSPTMYQTRGKVRSALTPFRYDYLINFRIIETVSPNRSWYFQIDPRLKMRAHHIIVGGKPGQKPPTPSPPDPEATIE